MISLHFTTQLPGFTLEADCELPGDGFTAVLGPSGCGKSTLAGSIAGLVKPVRGTIAVNGRVFHSDHPSVDLPVEKRGIGFVFQSHRLFPHLTVRENLLFGQKFGRRKSAADSARLIEVLGIGHLLDRRPDTLSGGHIAIHDESAVVHMTARPVRGAEADADVKAFMDFLASDKARAVLKKFGIQ